ncbi:MAG TPA: DUF362 domain-containing protein [Clostridia bacterium]|nr:DUF362 domain-containing protein [Clostridia bacterium]
MAKVWYSPVSDGESREAVAAKVLQLFDAAGFEQLFAKDDLVAVKLHFGEQHNTGHIKPDYIKPLLQRLKSYGTKPYLTDTNTLYKGQRTNSVDHLMQAYEHGFSIENLGVPVIIADGLLSRNHRDVPIKGKHFATVTLANDILDSDALVVLSHLTGHIMTGMGAAIKNLGMGGASRSGKQKQHADVKPVVDKEKCRACGACLRRCPKGAISYVEGVAFIDHETCYGCAECIAACRTGAVKVSWRSSGIRLQEKMVEYALGTVQGKENKICFFNFLMHVTKECDCVERAQDKVIGDIGILASYDPVAIDKASLDLLAQAAGRDLLKELWPENDAGVQLRHAEALGLGYLQYELVQV